MTDTKQKKLGQHFLVNQSAIKKIIAALDLKPADTIIEIGPGKGALTLPLAEKCQNPNFKCQIIAIEKDRQLVESIKYKVLSMNGEIIQGDALKVLPKIHTEYKLVGNIPYYITGKLLRILSELRNKPSLTVLTIQKEVAERICAKPPQMNLLAAAVQFWAEPRIIAALKSSDFNPPPKVDSAIIKLSPKTITLDPKRYYPLIKIIFKQPRKTLLNNLSEGLKITKIDTLNRLKKLGFNEQTRAQELNLEQIIGIVNNFS